MRISQLNVFATALALVTALGFPSAVLANDLSMGDLMPNPRVRAFIIKVVSRSPANGRAKVHTLVGDVEKVIKGNLGEKRVGIVLPMERYSEVPAIGSRVFVMTGSSESPYTPAWMMHGFVPIGGTLSADIVKCAELSAAYVQAAGTDDRKKLLDSIREVEKSDPKVYWIAKRLPYESCKTRVKVSSNRAQTRKNMRECLLEYGESDVSDYQ